MSALFLIGRSSYAVEVDLYTQRVVAGSHANGSLTVRNTGSRRLLPSRIELAVGASLASFRIPGLAGGGQTEDLFVIPTTQRSVISVGPAVSVRGDALGLLRRQVRWTEVQQLYVHPRTVRLSGTSTGVLRDLEGQPTRDLSSNDVSFHALRPYVPGDDRRYVHWRTSARTGALMVRQFEETRRTHLALALSASPADYGDAEEFELAVSIAASLSVQAIREERPVTVCVGPRVMPPGSGQRFLDGFAGVRSSDDAGLLRSSLAAASAVPNASVAILVTGSVPDAAVIRRAGTHVPGGDPGGRGARGAVRDRRPFDARGRRRGDRERAGRATGRHAPDAGGMTPRRQAVRRAHAGAGTVACRPHRGVRRRSHAGAGMSG